MQQVHFGAGIVPVWLFIIGAIFLAIILIKTLHICVFALFHPHAWGVVAVLALILFLFVGLWSGVRVENHQAAMVAQQRAVAVMNAPNLVVNPPNLVVNPPNIVFRNNHAPMNAGSAPLAAEQDATLSHQEKTNESVAEADDRSSTTDTTSTNDSNTAKDGLPTWTSKRSHKQGDSVFYVVHLGAQDTSSPARDDLLDAQMLVAAQQYIDEKLYPGEDVSKIIHVDANYLRDNCLKQTYPAGENMVSGKDFYAQLDFDKKFRAEVDRRYRQIVGWDHLQRLGNLATIGLAVLGGLYIYLRTTTAKHGTSPELEVTASKA
jgi:hypothetical protein